MTLTNVVVRGKHFDVTVDRGADGKVRVRRMPLE